MANASVVIYNVSREKVAYLNQAFDVGYEQRINELHRAWFSLPYDDPHLSEVTGLRYAEIYNGDERVDLFRIIKKQKRGTSEKTYYRFECEHVFATLMNDEVKVTLNSGPGTITSIGNVLDLQGTGNWTLGSSDFDRQFLYTWAVGTSLLEAMTDIPARFGCSYQWTFDTSSYPWTVNLIEPPATVTAYLDRGRNLLSVDEEEDYTQIITRLYPYGNLAGDDQLDITGIEPSSNAYVSNNVATYGLIERIWIDQRYSVAQNLYDASVSLIAEYSVPRVKYSVAGADLYSLTGESIDEFVLGALVEVTYDDLDISVQARIVSINKSDVNGAPGDVGIQVANKAIEFDFRDMVQVNDLSALQMIDIPGGVVGALVAAPSVAGLYASTSFLGFSDGTNWRAYFDIDGKFKLVGDADHYLTFDPDAVVPLTIKSDGEWIGSVSISNLTAGDLTVAMNLTAGGSVKSNNYAAGTTGWAIDNDGSAEFSDVTVRGVVEASTGTIGGWTIGAALTAGAGASAVGLAPGTYPFYAGNATPASASFSVSAAGAIKATSGEIAGFTISSDGLYVGDAATRIQLDKGTGIWLGATIFADAPFKVTRAGALVATGAEITGDLEMIDGSIVLESGDPVDNKIWINDTAGELRIGGTSYAAAPFQVSAAGALEATSGEIGGVTIGTTDVGVETYQSITVGSGAAGIIDDDITDYAFFAGNSDPSSADFWVKTDGSVNCDNIAAGGGTIGGFTIAGDDLYTDSKVDYDTAGVGVHVGIDGIGVGDTFKVSRAGVLTCSDAVITGDLEMTTGSIEIVNGTDTIWLNRTAGELRIGGTSYAAAPFQVSAAGALEATSGEIGGATIGTDRLTIGSGAATAGIIKGEANNIAFYAGSATPLTADFWVKTDGSVNCENIAASGGTIGGFTIATHLYTDSKTAYGDGLAGVHVGTDGIGLGSTFKVSAAGVLTCTGASIGGSLNAGDIDSGTMNFSFITQNSVDIISTMMHNNSVGTAAIVNNSVNVDKIYINGTVVFNADGSYHNITGISDLRGPVWSTINFGQITFPTSSTDTLDIEYNVQGTYDSISLNNDDGTERGIRIYAPNGVIRMLSKDAGATALAFENWYSSGGASTYSDKGAIKVKIGATTRYIRLFESYSA